MMDGGPPRYQDLLQAAPARHTHLRKELSSSGESDPSSPGHSCCEGMGGTPGGALPALLLPMLLLPSALPSSALLLLLPLLLPALPSCPVPLPPPLLLLPLLPWCYLLHRVCTEQQAGHKWM